MLRVNMTLLLSQPLIWCVGNMDPVETLFENEGVLAIDKPSGLMVHTDGRSEEKTLVDWVRENYPELDDVGEKQTLQSGEEILRPGIVHRLDRDTSGVMLIAKTQEMFEHLKKQFQDQTIEKEYHALVAGTVKEDSLTINRPIGRSASDFRLWSAQRGARGKLREAATDIEVLKRLEGITYISAFPKTGRTHQIRVHLKAIHHPILCDPLYGFKDTPCPSKIERLALHAYRIQFTDLEGGRVGVTSSLPQEFEEFIASFNL